MAERIVDFAVGQQSSTPSKDSSPRSPNGVFRSVTDLKERKAEEPFLWKANPVRVLAAIQRGKQALESVH